MAKHFTSISLCIILTVQEHEVQMGAVQFQKTNQTKKISVTLEWLRRVSFVFQCKGYENI